MLSPGIWVIFICVVGNDCHTLRLLLLCVMRVLLCVLYVLCVMWVCSVLRDLTVLTMNLSLILTLTRTVTRALIIPRTLDLILSEARGDALTHTWSVHLLGV